MEKLMKPQSFTTTPSSANSTKLLAMHKDSHVISKFNKRPKIRIIHVFAPEIIKTDAANFRELVQNLTGNNKPDHGDKKTTTSSLAAGKSLKKMEEQKDKFPRLQKGELLIKEEIEEIWRGEKKKIHSFLDGFSDDLDGFIEDLNQFHSLPLPSSIMDVFEGPKII